MAPQDKLGEVIDGLERYGGGWIIDGDNPKAKKALEDWRTHVEAEASSGRAWWS